MTITSTYNRFLYLRLFLNIKTILRCHKPITEPY